MRSTSSLNHILLVGSIFPLLRTPIEPLGIIHEIPLPFSPATCPALTLDTFPSIRAAVTTSVGGFPRPLFDLLPALEIISNFGVGVDSIGMAVNEQCEPIDLTIQTGTCILIDAIRELKHSQRQLCQEPAFVVSHFVFLHPCVPFSVIPSICGIHIHAACY